MRGFRQKTIRTPKSVGERLAAARHKKNITLEEAETATKVRFQYLEALEHNDYASLPVNTYTVGFLLSYAHYLGLNPNKILKQYKEELAVLQKRDFSHFAPPRQIRDIAFSLTPKAMFISLVVALVMILLGYIGFQIKSLTAQPRLDILQPAAQAVVNTDLVEIVGVTDDSASVKINNQMVSVDEAGKFIQAIKLTRGFNKIEVVALNRANKETKKSVEILANL